MHRLFSKAKKGSARDRATSTFSGSQDGVAIYYAAQSAAIAAVKSEVKSLFDYHVLVYRSQFKKDPSAAIKSEFLENAKQMAHARLNLSEEEKKQVNNLIVDFIINDVNERADYASTSDQIYYYGPFAEEIRAQARIKVLAMRKAPPKVDAAQEAHTIETFMQRYQDPAAAADALGPRLSASSAGSESAADVEAQQSVTEVTGMRP